MSTIPRDDVAHLAKLARLELTEEQLERYTEQLGSILQFVEALNDLETGEAAREASKRGVSGSTNHVAADELRSPDSLSALNADLALQAAPLRKGRFIQVRAVLVGEEESA